MKFLSRILGDLSVGRKLSFGFSLVLLSTLGVAATAFHSLGLLQLRSERMLVQSKINGLLLTARIAEKEFALNRSPAAMENVRQSIGDVGRLLHEPGSESSDEALKSMEQTSERYLQQFLHYTEAMNTAFQSQLRMQEVAKTVADRFASVFLDQLDLVITPAEGSEPDNETLIRLEQASTLDDKLRRLRDSELYYLLEQQDRFRADWEMNMTDTLAAIETLALRLGGDQQGALYEAKSALEDYRQAFMQYIQSHTSAAQSATAMDASGQQLSALLEKVTLGQQQAILEDNLTAYTQLGMILLLAMLFGLGATLLIRKLILTPLYQSVQLAKRVSEGDLSLAEGDFTRRDELGQMLLTVRSMVGSLREMVGRTDQGTRQLNDAARCLSEVTSRTSRGVDQQRQETEQAAIAMQQLVATAQEVARNTGEASLAAAQAEKETREGDQVVSQASGNINSLADEMAGSATAIRALLQESEQVGGVLLVIKSLADQTNLLALNAAIEAARAGEHGRGFAVVADEVRALARRTQNSTAEIETLIERLRNVSQEVAERIDGSRELTEETRVLTAQAALVLSRITQAVSSIDQMNQQIAAAAEEQCTVAEQVNHGVSRVRDVAEESARSSLQLQDSTVELEGLSRGLREAIGRFRI